MKFNPIGHFDPNIKEVDVVGAGISGLSLSYFLSLKGYEINLFEKSNRISGKIISEKTDQGIVEKAANTLLLNNELKEILDQLGLNYVEASPKLKKQVYLETKKLNLLTKLKLLLKILCGLPRKLPMRASSLQEFFSPLMGKYFSDELISTVLGGIYGIGSDRVSPLNMFPIDEPYFCKPRSYFQLFRFIKKQNPGKRIKKMISFKNGMEDLPKMFYEKTKFKSVNLNKEYEIDTGQKKNVIICTNALQAAAILERVDHPFIPYLKETSYQALNTTTYFLKSPIVSLHNSFGMLFSPNSNFYSLGVLSRSEIFNLPNQNSYNFISNGIVSPTLVEKDLNELCPDKKIENKIKAEWKEAIPVMDHRQFERLSAIKQIETGDNILLFSHYLGGVSLRDIILSAKKFTANL